MADKQMNQFTTSTDGAYIYAEASNGSQVKISKAALKTLILDIGNMVMRNRGNLDDSYDLNEVTTPGIYNIYEEAGLPENIPYTGNVRGVFVVHNEANHCAQIFYASYGGIYTRATFSANTDDHWSAWKQLISV